MLGYERGTIFFRQLFQCGMLCDGFRMYLDIDAGMADRGSCQSQTNIMVSLRLRLLLLEKRQYSSEIIRRQVFY
jgi:hypothetical protein